MSTLSPLPIGLLLDGRYRLSAIIGHGGMGVVYEAQDARLGRRVAVKVIHDASAEDESFGERLFREAKAAARADHPAVITVYGYGTDAELGISYIVMERLSGETLAQRIEQAGQLDIAFVLQLARAAADALMAVHAAGVVHRDLKPSNFFLATRGMRVDELKLLDFGVAKQLDLHTLTITGQVYGTPAYMAPEQLKDSKHVDERCDIYALGAVLFECLAGRPPFTAPTSLALATKILLDLPPDLRTLRSDVPEALAAVVSRCLARSPRDRFVDARSLLGALR